MNHRYLLIIYLDFERTTAIYVGNFKKLKNIISYTNGLISYHDIINMSSNEKSKYTTYKNLFQVIKI